MIAITRVLRDLTRDRLTPLGIDPVHIGVLALLTDGNSRSQRDLGRLLRTDRTTVVRLIDELEAMGFVERQTGADRRINSIQLTALGHDFAKEVDRAVQATQAEILASLTPSEQTRFVSMLQRVHDSLPPFEE